MNTLASVADELLPISLTCLPVCGPVGVNVYLRPRASEPALLFCAAHQPITRAHKSELASIQTCKLFIQARDRYALHQTLRDRLPELVCNQDLPVVDRLSLVASMAREVMRDPSNINELDAMIDTARLYGSAIAQTLGSDEVQLSALSSQLPHDYDHWTHATSVSIYATLLARQLGWSPRDLERIALGGLLHDLGKLEIDPIILNKPGRLDDAERRLVRQHPALGLSRLIKRTDLCEGVMMMIYQHHERIDGAGYPVGIGGEEIHPWGRLCAIANVYEAMQSECPYRPAIGSATTLTIAQRASGTEFDQEMLACWLQIAQA